MNANEIAHKGMYDRVREQHPEIPAWEDLTEDQANDEHIRFMNDLGDGIRRNAERVLT
jgi:hypothetical protein